MTTPDHRADTDVSLWVIAAADLPDTPPCCERAYERGYRAGYRHGYTYALWDMDKVTALGARLWCQIERFLVEDLRHWVWRAAAPADEPVTREGGPRLRLTRLTRRRQGGHP